MVELQSFDWLLSSSSVHPGRFRCYFPVSQNSSPFAAYPDFNWGPIFTSELIIKFFSNPWEMQQKEYTDFEVRPWFRLVQIFALPCSCSAFCNFWTSVVLLWNGHNSIYCVGSQWGLRGSMECLKCLALRKCWFFPPSILPLSSILELLTGPKV